MSQAPLKVSSLRCEYLRDPLGVETQTPRLSWRLESPARGLRQTSYRILVATSADLLASRSADVWDSGEVQSAQSNQVLYAGPALKSGATYHWTVRAWDNQSGVSEFAPAAKWTMGLLEPADWLAKWIAPKDYRDVQIGLELPPSPLMRSEFTIDGPVKSAHVFFSGLGYSELHINGAKVGDNVLDPTVTRYDVRAPYVVHDVTGSLTQGANAVGVVLGNGWYNCATTEVWSFEHAPWRDKPKLRLQIEIEFTDGTKRKVITDTTWRTSTGPIIFNELRNGEEYDARLEQPGWDTPGFDDSAWKTVEAIPAPGGALHAQLLPVRVTATLTPKSVTEVKPGVWICDVGQNMSGWAQLTLQGPSGTTVTLKYSENLGNDGDIDQSNINVFIKSGDCQTDRYTLKGEGVEVWEPHFTFHGFRYIQITGFPGTPTIDHIRARVVRTDFDPVGDFSCSNEVLTRTFQNTRWSYISNFVGIPTDCPHREKNGWTGDANIAAEAGLMMFRAAPAYLKWLDDISDAQRPSGQLPGIVPTGGWGYNWGSGPAWDSIFTHLPWYLCEYEGDLSVLAAHYAGMKLYVDYMTSMGTDGIVSFGLGDWCPPGTENATDGASGHASPAALTSTGYYYANCGILSRAARLLGKAEDALHYEALGAAVKEAFNRHFYDDATGLYAGKCQTSQACALYQGLVDDDKRESVLQKLIELIEADKYTCNFGILGAKYVPNALTMNGRSDIAYKLARQTEYPSWGHFLTLGLTTLAETWEAGNSRNHIMFGDIAAWMIKAIAGINPDPALPGFEHFFVSPYAPADVTWMQASHDTAYGLIRSAWRREGDRLVMDVAVPPNTTATVNIPTNAGHAVTEGGRPLADAQGVIEVLDKPGHVQVTVGSGSYVFES